MFFRPSVIPQGLRDKEKLQRLGPLTWSYASSQEPTLWLHLEGLWAESCLYTVLEG